MHVVHVAPIAFGTAGMFGGGERYALELAKALARIDGVTCELVTFGRRAATGDLDGGDGDVRVRVLSPVAHLRRHPAHPLALGLPGALSGADVVHTHHLRSAPSRLAALTGRLRGQQLVTTDHGQAGSDWFGLLPALFHRLLAVSRYSASVLDFPAAKTRVVYGGADPDRFTPEPRHARAGVLFVGRLTPHKGVDRLLRALPGTASLTIAGTEGHDRDRPERDYPALLRQLAVDRNVRFVDGVNDDGLASLHRRAAVVAVPSVDVTCYGRRIALPELLGLSAIEAMASGTPVVASRLGGLAEVVVDGETGYLVTPGAVEELHDRLAELLADPARARRMGDNARAHVLEHFTWARCADRCLAAYRELVG